jgi:hypothetical protein
MPMTEREALEIVADLAEIAIDNDQAPRNDIEAVILADRREAVQTVRLLLSETERAEEARMHRQDYSREVARDDREDDPRLTEGTED